MENKPYKFKTARAYLGDIVRDRVTGFQGMVTARTVWLNGCARLGIQRQDLHEGLPQETQWFDDHQLEVITKDAAPWAENIEEIEEAKVVLLSEDNAHVPNPADVVPALPEIPVAAARQPGGPRQDPKGPRS